MFWKLYIQSDAEYQEKDNSINCSYNNQELGVLAEYAHSK